MNIAGIEYNLKHKALEIYLSGCNPPHCEGCHNEKLWDFNYGKPFEKYKQKIYKQIISDMVEQIWVLGGEPLDQDRHDLYDLLSFVGIWSDLKPIVLFTGYDDVEDELLRAVLSYAKVGEYQKNSESYVEPILGITLASKNQKVVELNAC